jgi:hypothetical protein
MLPPCVRTEGLIRHNAQLQLPPRNASLPHIFCGRLFYFLSAFVRLVFSLLAERISMRAILSMKIPN